MAKIVAIDKGSIAEEIGLEVGDDLWGFNGEAIVDILDYAYYDSLEYFVLNIIPKQGGEMIDVEIEKDVNEAIGVSLDESVQLEPIRCKNKCMFCFVDQLPKGMRDTLYVKDDDYRLSFISGNYVTFTNTTQKELDRIVKLHLSPLYVSVHAYDKEIKKKLVANPDGANLFNKIDFLVKNGIQMHTQIVMCKNINDKDVLDETIQKLYEYHPGVKSVAVVPVGMTCHRDKLAKLEPIDKDLAIDTINRVESFNNKVGGGFAWCSDEFYIKAGLNIPSEESYKDFCQIENGVGLCREFITEFNRTLDEAESSDKEKEIAIITGQSFKGILKALSDGLKIKYPNLKVRIVDIINNHFGKTITVAGLITAKDIIDQAHDMPKDTFIPNNMLREFTVTFLDGMTVPELEAKLNTKIHVDAGGEDLVKQIGELLSEK